MAAGGVIDARRARALGIAASALLVIAAIFLATLGDDGDEEARAAAVAAHFVSASELSDREAELDHPIYWAGPRPPLRLELSEPADGSVYLRYLPSGVVAGDPRVGFLTVGTYPVADAVGALRRTAAAAGVSLGSTAGGGVVLPNPSSRGSVYLAYPGSDLQVEVYDPAPGRALRLIRSGQIGPVG